MSMFSGPRKPMVRMNVSKDLTGNEKLVMVSLKPGEHPSLSLQKK